MLDNILMDITDRFSEQVTKFLDINVFIPEILTTLDESALHQKINEISENFAAVMNKGAMLLKYQLSQELKIYKKSVQQSSCLDSTLEEAILGLDEDMFPTLSHLALIHYTLPVSVATAERSFSTLKRLKTYLRNWMAEERLEGMSEY
jgi:hypothetical protein